MDDIEIYGTLYARPERLCPKYCWRNWPPVHTDDCGCQRRNCDPATCLYHNGSAYPVVSNG